MIISSALPWLCFLLNRYLFLFFSFFFFVFSPFLQGFWFPFFSFLPYFILPSLFMVSNSFLSDPFCLPHLPLFSLSRSPIISFPSFLHSSSSSHLPPFTILPNSIKASSPCLLLSPTPLSHCHTRIYTSPLAALPSQLWHAAINPTSLASSGTPRAGERGGFAIKYLPHNIQPIILGFCAFCSPCK